MRKSLLVTLVLCTASAGFAQLTPEQKNTDFMALVGLYDKNYAPYEWARDVLGFDLLNVKPWLDKVSQSKSDLEFYDICVRYVASLQDSHDEFTLPSDFEAFLPLTVDIYDGKVLIDFIDRTSLPAKKYPFQIGDELVSVDNTLVGDWITTLQPYAVNGSANPVSRNRLAASTILDRFQGWYPGAVNVGTSSTLVIRRQAGNLETYSVAWQLFGTPLFKEGPVPNPRTTGNSLDSVRKPEPVRPRTGNGVSNPWGLWTGQRLQPQIQQVPTYMQPLRRFETLKALSPPHPLAGSIDPFSSPVPLFYPFAGFKLRLGGGQTDEFVSGTFPVGKLNIGYIRIYSMAPNDETAALTQFQSEIAFFQKNTDGMVIDIMGNGGGDLCYTNLLTSYLIPTPFRTMGFELRATQSWVLFFSSTIANAEFSGAPQYVIDVYRAYLKEVQQALSENRGLTGPLPLCDVNFDNTQPARDSHGNNLAYTKPILVLTDNFTFSAAESFAATLQDAQRATMYGTRTNGGGGDVVDDFNATIYSEGSTRWTESIEVRARPVQTPGYPSTTFIENVGVYPDVIADYMTLDNLQHRGTTFVAGFSTAISNLIALGHP
jgi:hypothetical protein